MGERKDLEGPTVGHILRGSRTFKVPGGKLLHVQVDLADGTIVNVTITGDFFIYPEEALAAIERSLIGVDGSGTKGEALKRVNEVLSREGAQIIGFSPADLATVIEGIMK